LKIDNEVRALQRSADGKTILGLVLRSNINGDALGLAYLKNGDVHAKRGAAAIECG
jgi:hypothetical protein